MNCTLLICWWCINSLNIKLDRWPWVTLMLLWESNRMILEGLPWLHFLANEPVHSISNQTHYTHKMYQDVPWTSFPAAWKVYDLNEGRDSVVGIATRYGLDGPWIESHWGEIFSTCPDRNWAPPSLLYNGYLVIPGGKAELTTHPHLSSRLKKE
jgi:hypothetical protein